MRPNTHDHVTPSRATRTSRAVAALKTAIHSPSQCCGVLSTCSHTRLLRCPIKLAATARLCIFFIKNPNTTMILNQPAVLYSHRGTIRFTLMLRNHNSSTKNHPTSAETLATSGCVDEKALSAGEHSPPPNDTDEIPVEKRSKELQGVIDKCVGTFIHFPIFYRPDEILIQSRQSE